MMTADVRAQTSALEWAAAAVGLALLLFVTVVIGREALRRESDQPPSIAVEAKRIVTTDRGFLVEFEATNRTSGTAAAVSIEGELTLGSASETSTATLDYVAGNAATKGGLYFAHDPRRGRLQLRALGYQAP